MRNSIGKDLRKLYGVIEAGLLAGNYTLTINNAYSYQQNERKSVELSVYRPNTDNSIQVGLLLVISGAFLPAAFALQTYCRRSTRIIPISN